MGLRLIHLLLIATCYYGSIASPYSLGGDRLTSAPLGEHLLLREKLKVSEMRHKQRQRLKNLKDFYYLMHKSNTNMMRSRRPSEARGVRVPRFSSPTTLYKKHSRINKTHKYLCPEESIRVVAENKTLEWLKHQKSGSQQEALILEKQLEDYLFEKCHRQLLTQADIRQIRQNQIKNLARHRSKGKSDYYNPYIQGKGKTDTSPLYMHEYDPLYEILEYDWL